MLRGAVSAWPAPGTSCFWRLRAASYSCKGKTGSAAKRAANSEEQQSIQRLEGVSRTWWHRKVPRAWGQSCSRCPLADLAEPGESPAPQWDANGAEMEAALCQELFSCHSHPANPQTAGEDKILPSYHRRKHNYHIATPAKAVE